MDFNQALKTAGNPRSEIEARKRAALREFRQTCAAAEKFAMASIPKLQELNHNDIAPLIAQVESAGIHDRELGLYLFDLKRIMEKPNELQEHLRSLRAVDWESISSPPYKDEVDPGKRDALARHFQTKLMKFGDVQGEAKSLIERVRQRVIMLGELAQRNGAPSSLTLSAPHGGD